MASILSERKLSIHAKVNHHGLTAPDFCDRAPNSWTLTYTAIHPNDVPLSTWKKIH